jgi:hypothetical protein
VIKLTYKLEHPPNSTCHAYTQPFDAAVRTGAALAEVCRRLRDGGIVPDIVVGHAGWGETLFVKDVFPNVPLVSNFEFFYHVHGADVGFDAEFAPSRPDDSQRLKVRNALNRMGFAASDWGHCATAWQRSLFPEAMQSRLSILHEGVDTAAVRPETWSRTGCLVVGSVLSDPDRMQEIRDAARATAIRDFDLESCILPQWVEFLGTLIDGGYPRAPPPSAGLAVQSQLR